MYSFQGFNIISREDTSRQYIYNVDPVALENMPSGMPLRVNSAAYFLMEEKTLQTDRPNGRPDYQMVYVHQGMVTCSWNGGEDEKCGAGSLLLFRPRQPHRYSYLAGTELVWLHFVGALAEDLLKENGLGVGRYFDLGNSDWFIDITRQITQNLLGLQAGYESICNGLLLQLLGQIGRRLNENALAADPVAIRLRPAFAAFNEVSIRRDLGYYAELCHLSESRFAHLFTVYTGQSFTAYIRHMQMERAANMLLQTNLSVGEISKILGYGDPLYFSRLFRQFSGLSPRRYRIVNGPGEIL